MNKFNTVKDILDFAISQEMESHIFYMELVDFVEQPEMAKVLTDLASEELRHKEKLEAVQASQIAFDEEEVGNLGITERVQNVEPDAKMDYVEMLVVGMKREECSRRLYSDLASIAQNQRLREMFLQLAREESEHKLRFEIEYDLMTF